MKHVHYDMIVAKAANMDLVALIKDIDTAVKEVKKLSRKKIEEAIADSFNTFSYAYEAGGDTRSVYLYRAMKHAHDLGFTFEENNAILKDIADYHGNDIEKIFKRSGLNKQMERLYEKDNRL